MAINILVLCVSFLAPAQEESALQKIDREVTAIVEKVRPSVVQVTAVLSDDPQLPAERLTLSGVIYSKSGHIVTDASGIDSAVALRVIVGTKTLKATHVASDRRTGVAVIKIDAEDLVPAECSEKPARPGALAIVVGNPFGAPGGTATGSVSGFGRSIQIGDRHYENMVQMSVPVNPGDCGGYVADSSGRLIGLVHSVYAVDPAEAEARSYLPLYKKNPKDVAPVPGQSASFATPVEWVKFSADRIIKHGKMVRGWLGLALRPLDEATRMQLGLEEGVGVEVMRVDRDGPGKAAKIGARDILIELDGKPVKDLEALQWRVARIEEPTLAKLVYLRNRERHEADLRIEIDPQK